jgi:hypothetical protein
MFEKMKKLFTLRTSEKDGFHLLIFAAVMCLVMPIFIYWAAVNLQDPQRPDYYYLPRLYFGIIFLLFWLFYVIKEITYSTISNTKKSLWQVFVLFAFPIASLLYVCVYARSF